MSDLDAEGNIHTANGSTVPPLQANAAMFIDKTIAIYGPSKTGKTVITKHIMKLLNDYIEQILVVAPTEPSNRSYEGFVDPPFIHYRLFLANENGKKTPDSVGALNFLECVWRRQEMMAAIYTRANKLDTLADLFQRIPKKDRAEGFAYIKKMNDTRLHFKSKISKKYPNDEGRRDEKLKEVDEKFNKTLIQIYKKFIFPHYESLWLISNLSEDEQYSLKFLNFNPRLLLIFDDCAAQLKPLFNKDIFRKLFYQNRHSFITVILCFQDDTDLPPNLRKNAFVNFFTESVVCTTNFERSKLPKETKLYIMEIIKAIFSKDHRKLAYIREDDTRRHFYHVQFPYPKKFKFGGKAFRDLCEYVQSSGSTMDKENPFYENFKI